AATNGYLRPSFFESGVWSFMRPVLAHGSSIRRRDVGEEHPAVRGRRDAAGPGAGSAVLRPELDVGAERHPGDGELALVVGLHDAGEAMAVHAVAHLTERAGACVAVLDEAAHGAPLLELQDDARVPLERAHLWEPRDGEALVAAGTEQHL